MKHLVRTGWQSLEQGVRSQNERLLHAAEYSFLALDEALQAGEQAFAEFLKAYDPQAPIPPEQLHREWASRLLETPARNLKMRSQSRALLAVQDYRAMFETLVRPLPAVVELSWPDLAAALDDSAGPAAVPLLRRRKKTHRIPLRRLCREHLRKLGRQRASLDGEIQLVIAKASLAALEPWQVCRWLARRAELGEGPTTAEAAKEFEAWQAKAAGLRQRSERLQAQCKDWLASLPSTLLALVAGKPAKEAPQAELEYENTLRYWFRQQRGVQALIDLEFSVLELERRAGQALLAEERSILAEHSDLHEELQQVIAWLAASRPGARIGAFPSAKARVVPAEERVRSWKSQVATHAGSLLPVAAETVNPSSALPGVRPPWKSLKPRRMFHNAVEIAAVPKLLAGYSEIESAHRAAVREIEHAREVVAYALEQEREIQGPGENLLQEALQNAASLLEYQRQNLPDVTAILQSASWQAQAAVGLEFDIALEESRWGFWAYRTRRKWRARLQGAGQAASARLRAAGAWAWNAAARIPNQVLLQLGWITAPELPAEAVKQRARLEEVLKVALVDRDVPAIYRRLFRLAPVEDPRFLVGRENELNGIADALARWSAGQFAAILLVGMRGSGKSSLLNVATLTHFQGLNVTRCQMLDRVTTAAELHDVLCKLLNLNPEETLEEGLSRGKRVIILEEFERSFIRDMNGFAALDELLHLIQATAAHVFWIVSLNEVSFRYLEAVRGVSRTFSHRINAVAVGRKDLVAAIAQRHGLSGLRLEFAPLPPGDPRIGKLRRFLGVEPNAEEAFYTSLYSQSEGVFRAAFELWQACVDRVEGGVVYLRQPLNPRFASLLAELNTLDYFTLQAIVQHGGLTVPELARVLREPEGKIKMRMERLSQIGIIENEPDCRGMRVAPEAGGVVRDALTRRNLY